MRVAIVGPYPVDGKIDKINGGVQAVIINMVKGLLTIKDLDIHIITANFSVEGCREYSLDGITIHAVPLDRHFGNIRLYRNTRKEICVKLKRIQPDIVHSHMFGYYTLAVLESISKKVVVSTHGVSYRYWDPVPDIVEKIRRYFQDYIYDRCERMAKYLIVNSPFVEKLLLAYKDKKIYRLNNPISDMFFEQGPDIEEENRLLFAGNICEGKGIISLFYSIDRIKRTLRDIRLFIAGRIIEPGYYRKLIRFIKERGLERHIFFLGELNETDLKEEYRKASIFVFPSLQDVAPMAILQAMAMGKAVIGTDVGGIPYIIDHGTNGILVKKDDHDSLTDNIVNLVHNKGLRKTLGLNAMKKISKEYRIDTVTAGLIRIYREVIDG